MTSIFYPQAPKSFTVSIVLLLIDNGVSFDPGIHQFDDTVLPLVMQTKTFRQWLNRGHLFALSVSLYARPVYGKDVKPKSQKQADLSSLQQMRKRLLTEGIREMKSCLSNGAEDRALSAGYRAIFEAFTGIVPPTGNPVILQQYCTLIMPDISARPDKLLALLELFLLNQ